jgi:hypothetical protein
MKRSTKVFTVLAVLALMFAGAIWQQAWRNAHMARPVFESPIHFDEAFSFTDKFTLPFSGVYWVEVVCARTNLSRSDFERVSSILPGQLPVRFTITSGANVVVAGDSPNRFTSFSAKEVAQHLATFRGDGGRDYELSFHSDRAIPSLVGTKPTLRIKLSQGTTIAGLLLHLCTPSLACIIAAVGVLFALSPCVVLAKKCFRYELRDA